MLLGLQAGVIGGVLIFFVRFSLFRGLVYVVGWTEHKSIVMGAMVVSATRSEFSSTSRAGARSCRIRVVAFAVPWAIGGFEEPGQVGGGVSCAGMMALPAELADALQDGQLELFA